MQEDFDAAAADATAHLPDNMSNDEVGGIHVILWHCKLCWPRLQYNMLTAILQKLEMYALFKQGKEGDCTTGESLVGVCTFEVGCPDHGAFHSTTDRDRAFHSMPGHLRYEGARQVDRLERQEGDEQGGGDAEVHCAY